MKTRVIQFTLLFMQINNLKFCPPRGTNKLYYIDNIYNLKYVWLYNSGITKHKNKKKVELQIGS